MEKYPRGTKLSFICPNCGKTFERAPWEVWSKAPYCSRSCRARHQRGEQANRYTGGTIAICETCGKQFRTVQSKIAKGHGRFCSIACRPGNNRGESHWNWKDGKSRTRAYAAVSTANKQASKRGQDHRISVLDVERVYAGQSGRCAYCEEPVAFDAFELDHKQPFARGGLNEVRNIHIVCNKCNRGKGTLSHEEFLAVIAFRREKDK